MPQTANTSLVIRTRLRGLLPALVLSGVLVHASRLPAQDARATPGAWLQLGNDTRNMGVIPGSLEVRWQHKAPRPVRGLSVAEGFIVVGTESADADAPLGKFAPDQRGFVSALELTTGKPLWTRSVPNWVHGDPAIYKGRVYVTYGSFPLTTPGGVIALDLRTGDSLWTLPTEVGLMPAPLVDTLSQTLVIAGGEGILYEISLADGKVLHRFGLRAAAPMSSPRLGGRDVYVGGTRQLTSYSLERHALNWRTYTDAIYGLGNIPVALNDTAVFTSGISFYGMWNAFRELPLGRFFSMAKEASSRDPRMPVRTWFQQLWVLAFDRRDGHLLWKQPLGLGVDIPRNTAGTPSLADGLVLISSPHSGEFHAFDAATGARKWRIKLDAPQKGAITVVNGEAILGDRKSMLSFYRLSDGKLAGRCNAGGAFTVLAPIVVGKTLSVSTRNGLVNAAPIDSVRQRANAKPVGSCF